MHSFGHENHEKNDLPSIGQRKIYLFLILFLLVFPAYFYHIQIRKHTIRWDAIFANWTSIFYFLKPYTFYGHLLDICIVLFIVFLGYGLGHFLLHCLGRKATFPSISIAVPIGWIVLSYLMFVLALLQLLNSWIIAAVLVILFFFCFRFNLQKVKSFSLHLRMLQEKVSIISREQWIYISLIGLSIFYALSSSLMPPTQSDGLRYHLTVPKLYLEHGGFYLLPNIAFSNFPFLIEYLYMIPLAFGSISGPKLIHFCYFLFTLSLVYRLGKSVGNEQIGILSVLIVSTTPFVPIFASWSFIEFGLTCYIVLAFVFSMDYFYTIRDREWKPVSKTAVLTGMAVGAAISCKYTALALLPFFGCVGLWGGMNQMGAKVGERVKGMILILALAIVVSSPWFIRNALLLGNPVYPFAGSIFPTPYWSKFNAEFFAYHAGMKGNLNAVRQAPGAEKIVDFFTLPLRVTLFPGDRRENETFGSWPLGELNVHQASLTWLPPNEDYGSWPIGIIWLTFLPLIFLHRRWNNQMILHIVFAAFLFLLWAYTYRDTRFLLPSLAIVAPLYGKTIEEILHLRLCSRILFLFMILYGLSATTGLLFLPTKYEPWWVISGKVSVQEYLENVTDFEHYPNQAFRFLRENTNRDDLVLLHGIEQPFYCPNRYVGADWFNTDPLIAWSWECTTVEDLYRRLRKENIQYVIHDYGRIHRYYFYYRLFRLPPGRGVLLLREFVDKERVRVHYPYVYGEWLKGFQQRLAVEELNAPNVDLLAKLLDGQNMEKVYEYDESLENPFTGIRIWRVPDSEINEPLSN